MMKNLPSSTITMSMPSSLKSSLNKANSIAVIKSNCGFSKKEYAQKKNPKICCKIITELYAVGCICEFHEMFIRNTFITTENFIHLLF